MQKSPGGSVFPYYYKDGELFGLHLGSYSSDENGVISMMKAEEAFFLRQNRAIPLWIDFYATDLTDRVIGEFVEFVKNTYPRITKLGLVGCSSRSKVKINSQIKRVLDLSSFPVKYFMDPEEAKTWLVSEGE